MRVLEPVARTRGQSKTKAYGCPPWIVNANNCGAVVVSKSSLARPYILNLRVDRKTPFRQTDRWNSTEYISCTLLRHFTVAATWRPQMASFELLILIIFYLPFDLILLYRFRRGNPHIYL